MAENCWNFKDFHRGTILSLMSSLEFQGFLGTWYFIFNIMPIVGILRRLYILSLMSHL